MTVFVSVELFRLRFAFVSSCEFCVNFGSLDKCSHSGFFFLLFDFDFNRTKASSSRGITSFNIKSCDVKGEHSVFFGRILTGKLL